MGYSLRRFSNKKQISPPDKKELELFTATEGKRLPWAGARSLAADLEIG